MKFWWVRNFDEHIDRLTKAINRVADIELLKLRVTEVTLKQTGGSMNGVAPGGSGTFTPAYTPAVNAGLKTGTQPQYSTIDTNVTLTPAADGSSVSTSLAADATEAEFDLTVTVINDQGATLSGTISVPVLLPTPPSIVSVTLQQTA